MAEEPETVAAALVPKMKAMQVLGRRAVLSYNSINGSWHSSEGQV
jgi:hypothetical protein